MNKKNLLFFGFIFLALVGIWFFLPASDAASYFNFADQREIAHIPCFWDVVSNVAFVFVGTYGLASWLKVRPKRNYLKNTLSSDATATVGHPFHYFKLALSISIIWTGLGSVYFHWGPQADQIFWDRLPMVFVFGTVVGWLLADKINFRVGACAAVLLSLGGALSLILWKFELIHLKPYFILQYGGLMTAVLLCVFYPKGLYPNRHFLLAFGIYILAKMMEKLDHQIYNVSGILSGHTLKHFLAAYVIWILLNLKPKPNAT